MSEEETKPAGRTTTETKKTPAKKTPSVKKAAPAKTAEAAPAPRAKTVGAKAPVTGAAAKRAPASPARAPRERKAAPAADSGGVSEAARREMVEKAAYYRAQRRGFSPGYEMDDWLAAEEEITALLAGKKPA
jgi:hypothetical protein